MKKVTLAAAATLLLIETVSYLLNVSSNRFDWAGFGLAQFFFAAIAFFIGLVLVFIRRTSEIGKGLLLGTGIALLIGWTVCSNSTIRI